MSNITDLNKKREEKKNETVVDESHPAAEVGFEETMRANKEKADRMKKEREKANKGVIRSYRLKM